MFDWTKFYQEYKYRIWRMHIDLTVGRMVLGSAEGRKAYESLRSALSTPPLLSQFMRDHARNLSQAQYTDVAAYFFASSIGEDAAICLTKTMSGIEDGRSLWTESTADQPLCKEYLDGYGAIIRELNQSDPRVITCATAIFRWLRAQNATVFAEPLWGMIATVRAPLQRRILMSHLRSLQDETAADMGIANCLANFSTPDDVWHAAMIIVARLAQLHQAFLPVFVDRLRGEPDDGGYEQVRHLAKKRKVRALFRYAFWSGARRNTGAYTPLILPPLPPEEPRPIVQHAPVVITMDDLKARVPHDLGQAVLQACAATEGSAYLAARFIDSMRRHNEIIMHGVARTMVLARELDALSKEASGKVAGHIHVLNSEDYSGNGHEFLALRLVRALLREAGEDENAWQEWQLDYSQFQKTDNMRTHFKGDGRIEPQTLLAYVLGLLAASEVCGDVEFVAMKKGLSWALQLLSTADRAWIDIHARVEAAHAKHALEAVSAYMAELGHIPDLVQTFWQGFDAFCSTQKAYIQATAEQLSELQIGPMLPTSPAQPQPPALPAVR